VPLEFPIRNTPDWQACPISFIQSGALGNGRWLQVYARFLQVARNPQGIAAPQRTSSE